MLIGRSPNLDAFYLSSSRPSFRLLHTEAVAACCLKLAVDSPAGGRASGLQGSPVCAHQNLHVPAQHPRKRLPSSQEELLDETVKEDLGSINYEEAALRLGAALVVLAPVRAGAPEAPRLLTPRACVCAEHPPKRLPSSLDELLDEAMKEDLGSINYEEGNEDDSAMIDKLRSDLSADRYGIDISPAVERDIQ